MARDLPPGFPDVLTAVSEATMARARAAVADTAAWAAVHGLPPPPRDLPVQPPEAPDADTVWFARAWAARTLPHARAFTCTARVCVARGDGRAWATVVYPPGSAGEWQEVIDEAARHPGPAVLTSPWRTPDLRDAGWEPAAYPALSYRRPTGRGTLPPEATPSQPGPGTLPPEATPLPPSPGTLSPGATPLPPSSGTPPLDATPPSPSFGMSPPDATPLPPSSGTSPRARPASSPAPCGPADVEIDRADPAEWETWLRRFVTPTDVAADPTGLLAAPWLTADVPRWLARRDGEPVAAAAGLTAEGLWLPAVLAVAPALRSRGVARLMLASCRPGGDPPSAALTTRPVPGYRGRQRWVLWRRVRT